MTGFGAFLGKEFREIWRTWRLWVFPAIILFFAVSGPILAYFTKALLKSMAGDLPMAIPDPTWADSYASWAKNLSQLGVMALVIIYGGLISGELRQSTAILVLTKPVSRAAFVVAKLVGAWASVLGAVALGTLVQWALTRVMFREAPWPPLLASTGEFLLLSCLMIAVVAVFSALLSSSAAAAGCAFGVYLVGTISLLWGPALRYSPAGLIGLPGALAVRDAAQWGWPTATGAVLLVACAVAAVLVFRRREL